MHKQNSKKSRVLCVLTFEKDNVYQMAILVALGHWRPTTYDFACGVVFVLCLLFKKAIR